MRHLLLALFLVNPTTQDSCVLLGQFSALFDDSGEYVTREATNSCTVELAALIWATIWITGNIQQYGTPCVTIATDSEGKSIAIRQVTYIAPSEPAAPDASPDDPADNPPAN